MHRSLLYLLLFLLSWTSALACIQENYTITEIFFNPEGSDNGKEFVEIVTNQSLEGFIIADSASNDTLTLLKSGNSSTALIVENDGIWWQNLSGPIYGAGAAIGNGLGNSADSVYLYSPLNELLASYNYSALDSSFSGYSLELQNSSFAISSRLNGSPGYVPCDTSQESTLADSDHNQSNQTSPSDPQIQYLDIALLPVLSSQAYLGINYTSLLRVTNKYHPPGTTEDIFILVHYLVYLPNSTIEKRHFTRSINSFATANTGWFTPKLPGNHTICANLTNLTISRTDQPLHPEKLDNNISNNLLCQNVVVIDPQKLSCDISLELDTEKSVVDSGEPTKFIPKVTNTSFPYRISYSITDMHGIPVRSPKITTTSSMKRATIRSSAPLPLIIHAHLDWIACNNSNQAKTYASKLVVINGTAPSNPTSSIKVPTQPLQPAKNFKVTVKIWKDASLKRSMKVNLYAGATKLAPTHSLLLDNKRSWTNLTLTIQPFDCKHKAWRKKHISAKIIITHPTGTLEQTIDVDSTSCNNNSGFSQATPTSITSLPTIKSLYTRSSKPGVVNIYSTIKGTEKATLHLKDLCSESTVVLNADLADKSQYKIPLNLSSGIHLLNLTATTKHGSTHRLASIEISENKQETKCKTHSVSHCAMVNSNTIGSSNHSNQHASLMFDNKINNSAAIPANALVAGIIITLGCLFGTSTITKS